jgi:CP family cyanate transporter-like MFS transporter
VSIAALLGFAMWAPMFGVPPMEHLLTEELLLTHTQTSLLYAAPNLMIIALAIPAGIVADKIGVKKAVGIGVSILAVGAMLRGTTSDATSLLGFTFVYGVGLGWLFPNLPKLVSTWLPREQVGAATGIYAIGMFVGTALPLAVTMSLVYPMTGSYQGVLLVWGIPAVVAAVLWTFLSRKTLPVEVEQSSGIERKGQFRRLMLNKDLLLISALFFIHQFFFNAWAGWTPALMLLKGATPELAGLISSVVLWVGIPVGFLVPRLSERLGARKPILWISSLVMAVVALGAVWMNIPLSWLVMVIVGVAMTTRFIIILMVVVELVSVRDAGAASGIMLSLGYIGGIVGPLIGGYAFDRTGNLNVMLFILSAISVATIIISRRLPETGSKAKGRLGTS